MKQNRLLFFILITTLLYSCVHRTKDTTKLPAAANASIVTNDTFPNIPKPSGWVNDYVHLFSAAEIKSLDSIITDYEKKNIAQIAVTTVDSLMMAPLDIDSYALQMLRTWGIGTKEKKNGILILICTDMRRIRIENGYGIEKILSNEETKKIIDNNIIPYYKKGDFFTGTQQGILSIITILEERSL